MSLEGRIIGLIEDDPVMGESLVQGLSLEGAYVDWWRTGSEAIKGLRATSPDLVVCDIRLPDTSGDQLFREIANSNALPPFLFMTAYGDIDQAVRLIRAGAGDYVTKPFEMQGFITRASALVRPRPQGLDAPSLGASEAMTHVERLLRRVAALSSPLLLTGETGSGKEVCARFLHSVSPRAKAPWVAVNCAALPAELMESELFGHERGAFSGAVSQHRGYAERAGEGILFLDEIGDMPLPLQAKLLRLIEDRTFTRVGGEKPIPFKARVVCASNRDLPHAAEAGTFRLDLLHRINTVAVPVPPLRERADDIASLMVLFFDQCQQSSGTTLRGFCSTAYDVAAAHDWPGNVRELRNRVERAVALANGEWVMPADLFPERCADTTRSMVSKLATLSEARDEAERRQIQRALRQTEGQIAAAASLLGVSRTTLWEKMRRLEIAADDAAG